MANVWIEPIYDRTQADVDVAMSKIVEWMRDNKKVRYDLKGCLNVSDINRIEGNISFLSAKLIELGYSTDTTSKEWSRSGIPTKNDIDRILYNIRSLMTTFYQPTNAPSVPSGMTSYKDINAIEENLYLIKELLECMKKSFKVVGTFKSGATTHLPIRR